MNITNNINMFNHFNTFEYQNIKKEAIDILEIIITEYELDENKKPSLSSLNSLLLFLNNLDGLNINYIISISESGIFYLDWDENENISLTIKFKSSFMLEYSIFHTSVYSNKRNVFNGRVNVLDAVFIIKKLLVINSDK